MVTLTREGFLWCSERDVIQQDDADRYRNIASVTTAPGARNCAFIPESVEFCVTVPPRDDQPAKILVYKAHHKVN